MRLVRVRRASYACANHMPLWTGVRWLRFVWHQHSNSKRWIKQKEHKKANVDQELEPKKHPSRENRGWQDEENNIENAEQELQLRRFFGYSSCSVFSILFSSPCRPLLSLLEHSSWGLSYNSSQFIHFNPLSYHRALIVWECLRPHSLQSQRPPTSTVEESLQQTSITHSGSPHNALHSLVMHVGI